MSRSELFRVAVADYIEAHKHDQVREALDAVYSEQPSQLDEELMRVQTMSLPKEDWCTASTILAGCVNRFCRSDSLSDC